MKTILRGISMRLSLIAMVLCLCAAWPGHGQAWGMAGSASPAGIAPGAPGSQAEGEVQFDSTPYLVSYGFISDWNPKPSIFCAFHAVNFTEGMAMRVQLGDAANPNGIEFYSGSGSRQTLDNGGFWIPDEELSKFGTNVRLDFRMDGSKECTVKYTVSVYGSKDLNTAPLVSSTYTAWYMKSEQSPTLGSLPRVSGVLDEDIPFTFDVTKTGFLQGKPAKIKISLMGLYGDLTFSGQGIHKNADVNGQYILDIASFSATQITLTARATEECSGTVQLDICDAEGSPVGPGRQASIIIPIEYSVEDINALKAIAEANPLNTDLRNFISNKDYLKDRTESDGYNVGVTWSTESPSRVRSFFIDDRRTQTVTSMDLSALSGLEELTLGNTRLKSLDLSALMKLRNVYLNSNDSLTWFTVTLPSPLPENFNVYGYTSVMAGVPVDNGTAYAAKGTEIDLSAYATVGGVKSEYQWYRVERDPYKSTEASMPPVSGKEGAFVFTGNPGEYYRCEIMNKNYGNWRMGTIDIKVARGSADYSPADIAGLKKLVADNPSIAQLKEFVDSKGWENENWDSHQDNIRTDWNADNRLTQLYIWFDWNSTDTISQLDLSAFSELRYFECENYMNIGKLDVSKNTKLEHLHVYSKNLASLDLSKCPELRYFRFGTQRTGEGRYQNTKLATLNLAGCSKLTELYLEHSPLASLDISSFKQLTKLEIEYCPNLAIQGFDKATNLTYLALPHTTQFADLVKNLPATIRQLYLQDTEYALPSPQVGKNLAALGLPVNVESFDLAQYPNLTSLNADGSPLRYSTLRNYRSNVYYDGHGRITLTSPSHPESKEWFENGDTIDLSSEAVIDGIETVFLWVNAKYGIEEKEALKPVPDRPGVFVLDSKEEKYGDYYCKMMNPKFCEITEITYFSGWQIETSRIHVETTVPKVFAESDVATLARIVSASNNKLLTEWWSSNAWQTNEGSTTAKAIWNNENPRRLTELDLRFMGESFTKEVDLSALDKLEVLSLDRNLVEKLTLPTNNTVLRSLTLAYNTPLSSLIVSMYPALEYLDVSDTDLKACDVSKNKQLKELFLNGTEIKTIEENVETAPIAAQLHSYGVPKAITSIDLAKFPVLKVLRTTGSILEFSGVQNPRQLDSADGETFLSVGEARTAGFIRYGEKIDLSDQATVAGTASDYVWTVNHDTIDFKDNQYTIAEELAPNDWIMAYVTNPLFPGWTIMYETTVYTRDGDANLDKSVNVQDVTATVSYVLKDKDNMIPNFGFAEADVNYNNNVEIADVIGIANIIRDEPVTKASALRSEAEAPVQMELDADNFLTMNSQVPVAGIYLELVGAIDEIPLLGDAAKFMQASSLNGDTLRVIAYSLDGRTIPSGKSRIMRLPAGVTLVGASFSDARANSLRSGGDAIVTSNAPIEAISRLEAVSNYPNPFRGSTTFSYQLEEPAQTVMIHVFSANGALTAVLNGLPGEVGENLYTVALPLPAGVYYYRLTAKTGHGVKASNTNIFICK